MAVSTLIGWYRAGKNVDAKLPLLCTYLAHRSPASTYWYLQASPELLALAAARLTPLQSLPVQQEGDLARSDPPGVLHPAADRPAERQREGNQPPTVRRSGNSYGSPSTRSAKPPCRLDIAGLDAELIGAFLAHLESGRGNSVRTRSARLAAIHSLCRYAAMRHRAHAHTIARVVEISPRRFERAIVASLPTEEIAALLAATDRSSWHGRRDDARLLTAIQTGVRVAELVGVHRGDLTLGTGGQLRVTGKDRKQPITPRTDETKVVLGVWLAQRKGAPTHLLFSTWQGTALSPDGVARLLTKHVNTGTTRCPSLTSNRGTPHVLRHYVDAWVMWPAGVFRLLGLSLGPVPAT